MKKKAFLLLFFLIVIRGGNLFAQLTVVNGSALNMTPAQLLAQWLVGQGVIVSNATYNGSSAVITSNQVGSFETTGNAIGQLKLNSGLLMTSGRADLAIGPNNAPGAGEETGGPGDPDLSLISGTITNDKAVIEFDFIPQFDTIKFRYVFGSEEFYEFCTGYNDAFGFFLSGPGITGPYSNNSVNIAMMPDGITPVTIFNICADPFSNWVNPTGAPYFQYDGLTFVYTAWYVVQPCSTYHIKLAIADALDHMYDSGVFLEKGSFSSSGLIVTNTFTQPNLGLKAVEGCSDATVTFTLAEAQPIPYVVNYTIGGTATNCIDYFPCIPDSVVIPVGSLTASILIDPIMDGLTEGIETIVLAIETPGCNGTTTFYDTINIVDNTPLIVVAGNDTSVCEGNTVTLTMTPSGGQYSYSYSWSNGGTQAQTTFIPPVGVNTYIATLTDGCSNFTYDTVIVTVDSLPKVTNTTLLSGICSGSATGINLVSTTPGATFAWTATCTSPNITGYSAGTGTIILQTLLNSGLSFDTVKYFVHAFAGNCAGPVVIFKVVVKPTPNLSNSTLSAQICSNTPTNITLTSDLTGALFTWMATGSSILVTGYSDNSIPTVTLNQTLINSGFNIETVTYHITPHANGCDGPVTDYIVSVYPVPDLSNTPPSTQICNNTLTNITLISNIAGTLFTWTASGSSILVSGYLDNTIPTVTLNQTLINSGYNIETVTYHITPHSNGCDGLITDYVVTVYPAPNLSNTPLNQAQCSNTATGITLTSNVTGTLLTWTATGSSFLVTGYSDNPIPTVTLNQTLINSGFNFETVTYHIVPHANGCDGAVTDYVVTVKPVPDLSNTPLNMQVCNNTPTNQILTSDVAGTLFTWTATGSSLLVSGYSDNSVPTNFLNQTLVNSGLNPEYVTYHMTPHANGCDGPVTDYVVTVVSSPDVYFDPIAQTRCSQQISSIQVLSHVPGTTFTWTATASSPNLSGYSNGNGNMIAQTLTNSGITIETVTYTVYPTAWGCPAGAPQDVVLTVNPKPAVTNTTTTFQQCSSAATNIVLQSDVPGSSYTWTATGSSFLVSGYSAGSGNQIQQTLINAGYNTETVTYNITPIANGCPGDPVSFTVTVFPVPDVWFTPPSQSICPLQTSNTTNNSHVTGASFTWTVTGSSLLVSGYSAGSGNQIQQTLNNTGYNIETVTYHVSPTANGCPGINSDVVVTVDPTPVVSFTLCVDPVTTTNAQPIKLKGGNPVNGTYSGRGVSSGILYPALAGTGTDTIYYSYINTFGCSRNSYIVISVISPIPFICSNILIDPRDNNQYQTVQIGSQCWMTENLDYGTVIPSNQHQRDNCIIEKYLNPASSIPDQSSVYQWDELMQYNDASASQGFCPPGWHVPTEANWNTLFTFYISNGFAGNPLKVSGYSGFNAFLNGVRFKNYSWNFAGFATFFWSSTSHGPYKAWAHGMNFYNPSVSYYPSARSNAFPVRCLKD